MQTIAKCDICNRPIEIRTTDRLGIPIKNTIRLDTDTGHGQAIENYTVCPYCLNEVKSCIRDLLLKWDLKDLKTPEWPLVNEETTLKFYQKLVRNIWDGEYGDGWERRDKLRDLGVDPVKVQYVVNLSARFKPGESITINDLKTVGLL